MATQQQVTEQKKTAIVLSVAINFLLYSLGSIVVLYTLFAFGLQNTPLGTVVATICLEGGLILLAFNKRAGWILVSVFQFIIAYSAANTTASLIMLAPAIFFLWTYFRKIHK